MTIVASGGTTEAETYHLLGDKPFQEERDPFGFDEIAREIKTLILRSRGETPFTIGIEASWGRGKSSLMAQLRRQLPKGSHVVPGSSDKVEVKTVSFNAWTAEGTDALEGLVKAVLDNLESSRLRKALRNEKLMSAIRIPILIVSGWLRLGGLADEVWDRLSVDARRRNQINALVRSSMGDLQETLSKRSTPPSTDRLLVVFIDDLDRCSPENVLKVFEAMKVYLESKGLVFIVGYDRDVIGDAVQNQKTFSDEITGIAYIEKIVQTVFRIPLPDQDQIQILLGQYLVASGTEKIFDDADKELLIDRNGRNPRRMKRFVNRFILDYRLDEASRGLDPSLLIKLLILETYFPRFARLFSDETGENPIQEFLDFQKTNERLQAGDASDEFARKTLARYNLTLRADSTPQELLQRLEGRVPEVFITLTNDRSFTSLIDSLSNPKDQRELIGKVQRRKEAGVTTKTESTGPDAAAESLSDVDIGLSGRVILWIDDHPENNGELLEWLRTHGATIYPAKTWQEGVGLMQTLRVDAIISDVERGHDPEAGFNEVENLRQTGYTGPFIFYTSRITAERRARATESSSLIVDTEAALVRALDSALNRDANVNSQAASA